MEIAIGLIIGLALGLVLYLSARREIAPLRSDASALRDQLEDVQSQLQAIELAKNTADTQLTQAEYQIATLISERDQARTQLNTRSDELNEASRQLAQAQESRDRLDSQLKERTQERDHVRELLGERDESLTVARQRISETVESNDNLTVQSGTLKTERDQARQELDSLRDELSATQVKLEGVEADHRARQEELETYRSELEARFKGIATTVTESTREQFIKEFRDLTKQQSESSAELVGNTVKPLRESLERLDKGTQSMEKARENAYADLRRTLLDSNAAIGQLRQEASGLKQALRSPQVRGLWGEQQLQNVLEASGLREHVDFGTQVTVRDREGGTARPDVVVQIPGQRSVVIDAKTPLDSYLSALEAGDQETEQTLLNAHAASLLSHARSLGQKDYSRQLEDALDFVILFVPSDAILDAALRVRPNLFEQAWRDHRVLMAAPGSLIAFLRAVAEVWRQQTVQQNAVEIATSAHELYDRLSTYADHLDKMGRSLSQTVNHYNRSVGSFQSRVLSSARKIESLADIEEDRRIDEPSQLEVDVRHLNAPELSAQQSSATTSIEVDESPEPAVTPQTAALQAEAPDHVAVAGRAESARPTPARHRVRNRSNPPTGFTLWDERHEARGFRGVLQGVIDELYSMHRDEFARAAEVRGRTRQYVTTSPDDHNMPLQVSDSEYWIEGNHNGDSTIALCQRLLAHFGHTARDLSIHYAD